MLKPIFKNILLLSLILLAFGCSMNTSIKGEFLLENNFRLVKEFENDEQCSDDERWFLFASAFSTHVDETYELSLEYKNGEKKEFNGEYKIYVGSKGHSGNGYFIFDNKKLDLVFVNSYFLVFELPVEYNPAGFGAIRELHFQRW